MTDRIKQAVRADDAAMKANLATWQQNVQWQVKTAGDKDWRDLPTSHKPTGFYDSQYRKKP